jgi:Ankyrin repeats (3 copies)
MSCRFKWVSCQFESLRRCPPGRIRLALEKLPVTLDGTYERSLQDIDEAIWDYAHRLFQCMAVASRPFYVEELAEFLAFDFEVGQIPKLVEDHHRKDLMQAVLSTCSSLITVVQGYSDNREYEEDQENSDDQENRDYQIRHWFGPTHSKLVQFSHFSVKEFLISGRLAAAQMPTIRRYNILTTPAHTMVAKACFDTLLHLDEKVTNDSLKKLPLAEYAAVHWVDHALFENVSVTVQEGMKRFFDPTTRHFGAWKNLNLYPFQEIELPLHLAALYGLRDIAEFLIVQRAQDVNARQSNHHTPLSIASEMGNGTITRFLLQHGADTNPRDNSSCIPLNLASQRGHLEVVQILVSHGADLNSQDDTGSTPLHSVSVCNHWEVARALLEYGADASVHDKNNQMPLHLASKSGYLKVAQLLLDHGADANALDSNAQTALHLVFEDPTYALWYSRFQFR